MKGRKRGSSALSSKPHNSMTRRWALRLDLSDSRMEGEKGEISESQKEKGSHGENENGTTHVQIWEKGKQEEKKEDNQKGVLAQAKEKMSKSEWNLGKERKVIEPLAGGRW